MRKGKFPPKRLFIEDTLPRLGALSSSPLSCSPQNLFSSCRLVKNLQLFPRADGNLNSWLSTNYPSLPFHRFFFGARDTWPTKNTRKSCLIKIQFDFLPQKNFGHARRLANCRNYPVYFFSRHVPTERNGESKNIAVPKRSWRIRKLQLGSANVNGKYGQGNSSTKEWGRRGERICYWKRIGASILCSNFARTEAESGSVCTLPSPPTEFLRFAGFNYIDSLSYRVSLAKRVACKARPLSAL